MMGGKIILLALLSICYVTSAFYLPGVAPRAYQKSEVIPLLVNRLDSTEAIIPYDYYFFDFCEEGEETLADGKVRPHEGAKVSENLGQIIMGERIRQSPYEIKMMEDIRCRALCRPKVYDPQDKKDVAKFKRMSSAIKKDYMHHWILDNLPAVECTSNCRGGVTDKDRPYYRLGFPMGCAIGDAANSMTVCSVQNIANMYEKEMFINNHVDIYVSYHESSEFVGARIVGVEIKPKSYGHQSQDILDLQCGTDSKPQPFHLDKKEKLELIYSYSVIFQKSELKWASRWDSYLQSAENTSIHWFSIVNSVVIVLFLTGMVAIILVRTLYKDIARYNQADSSEEAQEEFGWKLCHGDVFRAPVNSMLLSVLLGTGVQVITMVCVTLGFACLGFLSPATRGGLMTAMVVLWVCLGTVGGYVSSRMYKMMGGEQWKSNVIATSFFFPGWIFAIFFVLNLILWWKESSSAVPFGTLLALVGLWFCISVPLTFAGAYLGFRKAAIEAPVRTNQIPRQIPPQTLYTMKLPAILMGGVLPFGCIFIQLFFILNSIWGHKLYYVFGFLFVVFVILTLTTIESTILLCYFHLCSENYHWWWRAFLTGGASSFYLFGYAILFYFRRMEVEGSLNLVLYSGYTLIATMLFWVATATIGFFGCFFFVRRIYSVVKVD